MGNKIDIIIPAYKAQKTILRTVSSIAEQTIKDDLEVTIVNDACPNGDYHEIVSMFSPYISIREIKLDVNGGPGVARQFGIDATHNPYFTCIDADDTFAGTNALEILRTAIEEPVIIQNRQIPEAYQAVSSTFLQLSDNVRTIVPHQNDMVWMFGKLYRRKFIDKYKIRFNETRANEDTGFNTIVRLLCTNPQEQLRFIPEATYYWHNKVDSITRINDGQYGYDQCFCGWTDNMIYAIEHVKHIRPFDGGVAQWSASCLMNLYFYYIECYARKKFFAPQDWEYVKKFYNRIYKKIADDISDEALAELYSMALAEKYTSRSLIGIIPHIGVHEFLDKLKKEVYDPDDIYKVWAKMQDTEEGRQLMLNNVTCGVCSDNYWVKNE